MRRGGSNGTERLSRQGRERPVRIPATSSDAAACALLLLTGAGVALQATQVAGSARLLLLGATALCAVLGFWRPRLWLAIPAILIIAGGATAGALALQPSGTIPTRTFAWIVASGGIAALVGLLAIWVSVLLRRVHRRVHQYRRAIDALTQVDPTSGAFKPHAGRERLRAEVTRAVRYRRPFTLLVGKARDWESEVKQRGMANAQEVYAETLRTATTVLRHNDIIASEPDYSFIVILPETTAEGGEAAARHIQEAVLGLLTVRFGLVQCPDDGHSEEALLREAREALAFAEMANLPLVSRRSLLADVAS